MATTSAHENLRSRYQAELVEAEKRASSIRAKLLVLDELAAEQRELEFAENGKKSGLKAKPGERTTPSQPMPVSPTEAALLVVNTHGREHSLTPKQILNHLIASGFVPTGKFFTVTLFKTLLRLKDSERISGRKTDGRWRFRAIVVQP